MLVAVAATLLSSTNFDGEGFEIFLNNKVVVQQFGKSMNEVKSLTLNQNSAKDQLTVKYYHCGKIGENLVIVIKDGKNSTLKEWRFSDATASITLLTAMNCNVKDILILGKGNENIFKSYYSSSELPNGRMIANLIV